MKGDFLYLDVQKTSKYLILGQNNKFTILKKLIKVIFKRKYLLNSYIENVESIAVTPNNKYIVSSSTDETMKVFDFHTKQLVYHYKTEHQGISNLKKIEEI